MSATYAELVNQVVGGSSTRPAGSRTIADALSRLGQSIASVRRPSIVVDVSASVRQREHDYINIYAGDSATFNARSMPARSISELGWTTERATAMRYKLAAWADDWNDPAMDAYDAL